MGMPAHQTEWTAEMVRALPDDGKRYEVLDGELLVSPAPSMNHQRVVFLLARILDGYVRKHGLGEVFIAPTDVEFSPKRLLQPDVFVIPPTPGRRPQKFSEVAQVNVLPGYHCWWSSSIALKGEVDASRLILAPSAQP
jgi:Uma2 family endonuclease